MPGPIPPFNNPPIEPQFYLPSRFVISDVALGQTTIVTATEDMNYVIGQLVRLLIPKRFGCFQLNNVEGYVIDLPADNEVTIDIDSSQNVNAFISMPSARNQAQIVPVGDINQGYISSTGRNIPRPYIPGSFINISPN